jgi:hypothetical protein
MYHLINTYKRIDEKSEQTLVNRVSFHTRDILDITVTFNTGTGEAEQAFLTLRSVTENGDSTTYQFDWKNHNDEVELLLALQEAMKDAPAYFEDEQGNIFPFDKILYVNAAKCGFVMAPGIDISLHPTKEWTTFLHYYRNWMDLTK